jgi:hypothetical protein
MNKEKLIDKHAQNLKNWVGTSLSKDECIGIIENAVNEMLYNNVNADKLIEVSPKLSVMLINGWKIYTPKNDESVVVIQDSFETKKTMDVDDFVKMLEVIHSIQDY